MENRIFLKDMRDIEFCKNGSRKFAKRYNLDFNKFEKEGITFEELLNTKSPAARKIVKHVQRKRALNGR